MGIGSGPSRQPATPEEAAEDAAWRQGIIFSTRKVYTGVSVVYLSFIVITAAWFVWRTRTDSALAKRSVFLTMLGFFGNLLISSPFLLLQAMEFPCFLILWNLYLGVTLTVFSLSARAWRLRYLFRSHQAKLARMKSLEGGSKRNGEGATREMSDEEKDSLEPWPEHIPARTRAGESQTLTINAGSTMGGSTLLSPGPNVSGRTIVGRAGSLWSAIAASRHGTSRGMLAASHPGIPTMHTDGPTERRSDDALASAAEAGHVSSPTNRKSSPSLPKRSAPTATQMSLNYINPKPEEEPTKRLAYILFGILALVVGYICAVTALSTQYRIRPVSYQCTMGTWEMMPVLVIMAGFFILGCPTLCWWLWRDNDTYGIRRDLIAFAISGTTVAVMYGLQQAMLPSGRNFGESPLRLYFGASNWPVLGVAVGHMTSIFLPLLASYDIHPLRPFSRLFRLYRAPSRESNTDSEGSNEKLEAKKRKVGKRRPARKGAPPSVTWALFASVLDDPDCFEAFKDFAARDFAAENPLFYQEYRRLTEKVRVAQAPSPGANRLLPGIAAGPSGESSASLPVPTDGASSLPAPLVHQSTMSRMSMADKYPVFDFTVRQERTMKTRIITFLAHPFSRPLSNTSRAGSLFNFGSRSQPVLVPPPVAASAGGLLIPPSMRDEYRTFYKTFISPGSPCQVNLPARIVEDVAKQVGDDSKVLPLVSIFDEARNEVLDSMFEMFPRFVEAERDGVVKKFLKVATKDAKRNSRRPTKDVVIV
ncbi:hypothetical protein SpCBS45565_g04138 [Spizellomyces sp. 'palustris']|nr:hypothetical protein SpCBS45565_g04138 [Spizellomyces sp. 'palustris']